LKINSSQLPTIPVSNRSSAVSLVMRLEVGKNL